MLSQRQIGIIFFIIALVWLGIAIYFSVDFEALFDTPEDVTYHFLEALQQYNFERAWSKLSARIKREDFTSFGTFKYWMYKNPSAMKAIAYAQIQEIDRIEERKVKVLLKNWYSKEYVQLEIVKEPDGVWKVDKFAAPLTM